MPNELLSRTNFIVIDVPFQKCDLQHSVGENLPRLRRCAFCRCWIFLLLSLWTTLTILQGTHLFWDRIIYMNMWGRGQSTIHLPRKYLMHLRVILHKCVHIAYPSFHCLTSLHNVLVVKPFIIPKKICASYKSII